MDGTDQEEMKITLILALKNEEMVLLQLEKSVRMITLDRILMAVVLHEKLNLDGIE